LEAGGGSKRCHDLRLIVALASGGVLGLDQREDAVIDDL